MLSAPVFCLQYIFVLILYIALYFFFLLIIFTCLISVSFFFSLSRNKYSIPHSFQLANIGNTFLPSFLSSALDFILHISTCIRTAALSFPLVFLLFSRNGIGNQESGIGNTFLLCFHSFAFNFYSSHLYVHRVKRPYPALLYFSYCLVTESGIRNRDHFSLPLFLFRPQLYFHLTTCIRPATVSSLTLSHLSSRNGITNQ